MEVWGSFYCWGLNRPPATKTIATKVTRKIKTNKQNPISIKINKCIYASYTTVDI